jgi:polysaccharide deacetylase family protein (PEP-CTERM system associated)
MNIFLFSVDLEDIRFRTKDGMKYAERLPALTHQYLEFLDKHKVKCTFFTVGDVAEKYPTLIGEIYRRGHEIACHSASHIELHQMTKEQFRDDTKKNMNALYNAGVKEIFGYRAPAFSLTEKTQWAYEVLEQLGIKYSSSVLPAKNPLNGWKGFGKEPKRIGNILEIPMNISSFWRKAIPFSGGVYFRTLPFFMIRNAFQKTFENKKPVLGYFHPYDIDTKQERFMHPGINEKSFYNFLMYYNRRNVFSRLEKIMQHCTIIRYCDYVKE